MPSLRTISIDIAIALIIAVVVFTAVHLSGGRCHEFAIGEVWKQSTC